ncbi:MAG: DUF6370 family protein [Ferruginibacter sp.]
MKLSVIRFLFILLFFLITNPSFAQQKNTTHLIDTTRKLYQVEAACGECQFKSKGNSCDLAIRMNGVVYFVDGTKIDDHGDAHAKNGFCNAIRKAQVQGEIKEGRFVATYFKLLEE